MLRSLYGKSTNIVKELFNDKTTEGLARYEIHASRSAPGRRRRRGHRHREHHPRRAGGPARRAARPRRPPRLPAPPVTTLTLRLLARSYRWIGPAVLVAVVAAVLSSDPGPPLDNLSAMLFLLTADAAWITVVCGNIDDAGHRDMAAARAGSAGRLHVRRAGAALAASLVVAAPVVTEAALVTGGHSPGAATVVAAAVGTAVVATLLGCAVGTLVHRPLVDNLAVSVTTTLGALIALPFVPPVARVLRAFSHGRTDGLAVLVALAALVAAVAVSGGAWLTDHL